MRTKGKAERTIIVSSRWVVAYDLLVWRSTTKVLCHFNGGHLSNSSLSPAHCVQLNFAS